MSAAFVDPKGSFGSDLAVPGAMRSRAVAPRAVRESVFFRPDNVRFHRLSA